MGGEPKRDQRKIRGHGMRQRRGGEAGKHTAARHEGDRRGVDRIQHAGRGKTKSGNGLQGVAAHGVVMA